MVHMVPAGMLPLFAFATHLAGWQVTNGEQSSFLAQSSSLNTGAFTAAPGTSTMGTSFEALAEADGTTLTDALLEGAGEGVAGEGVAGEQANQPETSNQQPATLINR